MLEYYITLSAEPVATMNSLKGLNDKQLTSAVWASTAWLALEVLFERVSQLKGQDTGWRSSFCCIWKNCKCASPARGIWLRALHHKLLVVCYRSKERLVKQMPRDVFNHSTVTGKDRLCIYYPALLGNSTDVPQTDCLRDKSHINTSNLMFALQFCKNIVKLENDC